MNCPNFRVLSDFRKDHGAFFRSCFKQTVELAMGLGLVSLGHGVWTVPSGEQLEAQGNELRAAEATGAGVEEIEALTAQAERCDEEEDRAYQGPNKINSFAVAKGGFESTPRSRAHSTVPASRRTALRFGYSPALDDGDDDLVRRAQEPVSVLAGLSPGADC